MNQKGQVLFTTIFISIIVLSFVLSISTRYLKSIKNNSVILHSNKALIAAESLSEILLLKDDSTLLNFIENNSCNEDCILTNEDSSWAIATIEKLGDNSFLDIELDKNSYQSINLKGYNGDDLLVCWTDKSSIALHYIYKKSDSTLFEIKDYYYSTFDIANDKTNFDITSANNLYGNCFNVDTNEIPIMLQVKSLYNNTKIKLVSDSNNYIPINGFKFNIVGKYFEKEEKITLLRYLNSSLNELNYSVINYDINAPLLKNY